MDFWPVGNNLYVTAQLMQSLGTAHGPIHNVWMADKSGSMHWAAVQCTIDMIAHLNEIPNGHYMTLGDFASLGDYNWYAAAQEITDKSRPAIISTIRKYERARGTTCFSEILGSLAQVLDNAAPFTLNAPVHLVLLTDGHPVVPNQAKERKAIFEALNHIKGRVAVAEFVGYGHYYNRSLLAEMAEAVGGMLRHADRIEQFGDALGEVSMSVGAGRIEIDVPAGAKIAFTIGDDGRLTMYSISGGKATVPQSGMVYYVGENKPEASPGKPDDLAPQYAAALAMVRSGDTPGAIDILSGIGDVAIVNALWSAVTTAEFGRAEKMMESAIAGKDRFSGGVKINCAPDKDAPDVLDVLYILANDDQAMFNPASIDGYSRIGKRTVARKGYPKFVPDGDQWVSMDSLVWHQRRLNLGLRAQTSGHVELVNPITVGDKEYYAQDVGLAGKYPVKKYRTLSFIADGNVNVPACDIKASSGTLDKLFRFGAIDGYVTTDPYARLHLDSIPVFSRGKAEAGFEAESVARAVVESTLHQAAIKAYNGLLDEFFPKAEEEPVTLSEMQEELLRANGISNGSYNPPSDTLPATDVMTFREFVAQIAGASSLPSYNKVRGKMLAGKPLTMSEGLVGQFIDKFEKAKLGKGDAAFDWLTRSIEEHKKLRADLEAYLADAKFAMLMSGQWFKGMDRADTSVDVLVEGNMYTVKFSTKEVTENI